MSPSSGLMLEEEAMTAWGDPFFPSNDSFPEPMTRAHSRPGVTDSALVLSANTSPPFTPMQSQPQQTLFLTANPGGFPGASYQAGPMPTTSAHSSGYSSVSADECGHINSVSTSVLSRSIPMGASPLTATIRGPHPYAPSFAGKRRSRAMSRNGNDDDDSPQSYEEDKRLNSDAKDYLIRRGRRGGIANLMDPRRPDLINVGSPHSLPVWMHSSSRIRGIGGNASGAGSSNLTGGPSERAAPTTAIAQPNTVTVGFFDSVIRTGGGPNTPAVPGVGSAPILLNPEAMGRYHHPYYNQPFFLHDDSDDMLEEKFRQCKVVE